MTIPSELKSAEQVGVKGWFFGGSLNGAIPPCSGLMPRTAALQL